MVVANNVAALNTNRQLKIIMDGKKKATEKLSSGYRINRSADDAAGLSISEKMRYQIRGLNKASQNISDGISFVQVADGALNETHSILQRMRELAVQASNDTNTKEDREAINNEITELKSETDRIFATTEFNTQKIWEIPYTPSIGLKTPSDRNLEIQVFNESLSGRAGIHYGGIEANNVRHRWDEMGINLSDDGKSFKKDQTIDFDDYTGEHYTLNVKAGDPLNKITRTYKWEAKDDGIYINKVKATDWASIGINTSGENTGTHSFDFRNMEISFAVNDGDTFDQVKEKINGKVLDKAVTWDMMPSATVGEQVVDIVKGSGFNVNENNKIELLAKFTISADSDGIDVISSDGTDLKKFSWNEFSDINNSGANIIADWGLTDIDGMKTASTTKTFDDAAEYHYENNDVNLPIAFNYKLKDEGSRDAVINGLNNVELNKTITSPGSLSAANATGTKDGPYVRTKGFQNLSYEDQITYGRDFNNANATLSGSLDRTLKKDGTETTSTTYKNITTSSTQNSTASTSTVYFKEADGKYYAYEKAESVFNDTLTRTEVVDHSQTAHYEYSGGTFAGHNIDSVNGKTFKYSSTDESTQTKKQTRTVTTYKKSAGAAALDAVPTDGAEVSSVDNTTETNVTQDWTTDASSKKTTYHSDEVEDDIMLKTDVGDLMRILVTNNKKAEDASSSIDLGFKASDFAKVKFNASANVSPNSSTRFNDVKLNPPERILHIQAGALAWQSIDITWHGLNNSVIGISGMNTLDFESSQNAIEKCDRAIEFISEERSRFGAQQNRLEHAKLIDDNISENTQDAESRIRDTDMATEMVNYSKHNILEQAGQSMLSQANAINQGVLTLLQ